MAYFIAFLLLLLVLSNQEAMGIFWLLMLIAFRIVLWGVILVMGSIWILSALSG